MLVWTRHHLLVDGWSAQLVIGELHRAYTALLHGRPWHARPDPGMAAYVAWLQKQNAAASAAHWRSALADAPLNPGLEAVRSIARGGRSARRIAARLTSERREALTKCAAANQLTLSTLIHGAWAAVLASLEGHPRVTFGSTVSGRPADLTGQDRIVGNLINTVPIVADAHPARLADRVAAATASGDPDVRTSWPRALSGHSDGCRHQARHDAVRQHCRVHELPARR